MSAHDPLVSTRTMNPGTAREFERVYLYCPSGHEVGSSPATNPTGRRWLAGDFSREFCGYGSCAWEGDEHVPTVAAGVARLVAPVPVIAAHGGWLARDGWGAADFDRDGSRIAVHHPEPAAEGGHLSYTGPAFVMGPSERITR